jgi:tetratricopeptide (TPR) repeat protein
VACALALGIGLVLAALSSDDGDDASGSDDTVLPSGHPALDGSDQFEELSLEELETEVADESAPVALRLTLAERYLATGDLEPAEEQARLALDQAATGPERQRALRDLGWAKALRDHPRRGAELLEEALAIQPDEPNTLWYLANVRLVGLDDPEGAIELLDQLLESDLEPRQRHLVDDLRAEATSRL